MGKTFAEILRQMHTDSSRKLEEKVPEWAGTDILIPSSLNLEQCSSSATARYKANLALSLCREGGLPEFGKGTGEMLTSCQKEDGAMATEEKLTSVPKEDGAKETRPNLSVADLTGGLGVDAWHFSKLFGKVLHNERNTELSEAVQKNFARLGVDNVEFSAIDADSVQMLEKLRLFAPTLIYMDPARRSAEGKKVFLLEDCSPNIMTLLPSLLELCPLLLVKISPMADITMLASRLGGTLRQVHIVGHGGECKELLCVIGRAAEDAPEPLIVAGGCDDGASFSFTRSQEKEAGVAYIAGDSLKEGALIFEPGAALMKTGAYALICERFNMKKFAPLCHLYLIDSAEQVPNNEAGKGAENGQGAETAHATATPACVEAEQAAEATQDSGTPACAETTQGSDRTRSACTHFGKCFRILEIASLTGSNIKSFGKKYPRAEVSAKGIMMRSDQLRQRLGVLSGGNIHIFGVTTSDGQRLLLACKRA